MPGSKTDLRYVDDITVPVIIIRQIEPAWRRGRGGHFDRAVLAVAPAIKQARAEGVRDIRGLVARLNEAGVRAPNGRRFTFGSMRRILRRLHQLHAGPGPRSLSVAANQRAARPYAFRHRRPSKLAIKQVKSVIDVQTATFSRFCRANRIGQ